MNSPGLDHPKMMSLITHHHVVPKPVGLSSLENKDIFNEI